MKNRSTLPFVTFGLCYIFLLFSQKAVGQVIADFENFNLEPDTFLNGSDGNGGFRSGNIYLDNSYTAEFNSWEGWAVSSMRDTVMPGFMNQFSAIPGAGVNGSRSYGVSFKFGPNILRLEDEARGQVVPGMFITNGTYPYLSMRDGDSFAKKFGGVTGNDPDFFLLTIQGYSGGILTQERVDFYLADFRFENNEEDYIVDDWTYVDLSSLGNIDSLSFSLSSSDVGNYGMNTPAYFCVDQIETAGLSTSISSRLPSISFQVYPNPAQSFITLDGIEDRNAQYAVYSMAGQEVIARKPIQNGSVIYVGSLPQGLYFIQVFSFKGSGIVRFVKQ